MSGEWLSFCRLKKKNGIVARCLSSVMFSFNVEVSYELYVFLYANGGFVLLL